MSFKLAHLLERISDDPQVKAAEEAAAAGATKEAHQPEMGMPAGGVTRSPMDGMIGNTQHDARARPPRRAARPGIRAAATGRESRHGRRTGGRWGPGSDRLPVALRR